jgi:hypothetical protein
MSYLKTIVRFTTKNPGAAPGSRHEFTPLRDPRRVGREHMVPNPGSAMSVGRPGAPSRALHSVFREGTDMTQVSSADFTYPQGQGGASEYFLNNIELESTTPNELYDMINVMVNVLQQTTPLLDGKRITKMYAADRQPGINADAFYQFMTSAPGAAGPQPLNTIVSPLVGVPGVITRPLVIVVELEHELGGGSKRKSRRKSNRKSRRR